MITNFCVAYTNDPQQLAIAEQYDLVICNQDAPQINTSRLGYMQVATEVNIARGQANDVMRGLALSYGDQFLITEQPARPLKWLNIANESIRC